ncbi:MAG TPA: FAD-dependent oxidoreductase, partial [Candidatus Thermoplasmatota archaeon]|nr:FAD-dependent oxidoreductase [Candidatus Thermoplasmatota archaeon]
SVVVHEKEPAPGLHQSGRNSGVVHAGYNLKPGSRKASLCVAGARRLRAYCVARGVPLQQGGILVVARDEAEATTLRELERRARANGVQARLLDAAGMREVEPHVAGLAALHAPEGASFDASAYVRALAEDARSAGAVLRYGSRVRDVEALDARVVVNAAGLHADRLAGALCPDMRIVPFRGYYAELRAPKAALVRSHVYAAPRPLGGEGADEACSSSAAPRPLGGEGADEARSSSAAPGLQFPFLGVHLSRRVDGRVLVGPGAMLAFGREAYAFWRAQPRDLAATLAWPGFWRFLADRRVLGFVKGEVAKSLSRRAIAREARLLVPGLRGADLGPAFAGNRAQMVDRQGRLVEDVVVRETERVVHVLNAVSPGLTCSLPFGEELARRAAAKL